MHWVAPFCQLRCSRAIDQFQGPILHRHRLRYHPALYLSPNCADRKLEGGKKLVYSIEGKKKKNSTCQQGLLGVIALCLLIAGNFGDSIQLLFQLLAHSVAVTSKSRRSVLDSLNCKSAVNTESNVKRKNTVCSSLNLLTSWETRPRYLVKRRTIK